MRTCYLLIIFLLTACEGWQTPEPIYNLKNLNVKFTIEPQSNIVDEHFLPLRSYENQTEELPHFAGKSNENISVFGTFYDEYGELSNDELLAITQNKHFECYYYDGDTKAINIKQNTFELNFSSDKYQRISINCDMVYLGEWSDGGKRTEESFLYPGKTQSRIVILPKNPLNEIIPFLNEMGYSPFKDFDWDLSPEIYRKYNIKKKRDKYGMDFINIEQGGPSFFWGENGITNIVFSISKYAIDQPNTIDSEKDVEAISRIVSKLTDIDSELFQKIIICKYWSYNYEEGSEMGDFCQSDRYRFFAGEINLSKKFKLTQTYYDKIFSSFVVSVSLK